MDRQIILAVGHGSRWPDAIAEAYRFTAALSELVGQAIALCFLELADPDLAAGLTEAARQAGVGGSVVVLPLFLGGAGHQKNDIAAALHWARGQFPAVTFRMGAPLAPHANLVRLLAQRIEEALVAAESPAPPQKTGVLVVGRGSSDPAGNSEVARLAYLLFASGHFHAVEYAFQAVGRPTVAEGIQRCHALAAQQVVVAPYLLFTGGVAHDIRRTATAAGRALDLQIVHATHLGVHPLLLEAASQRLAEAADGAATMNCDLCQYRFVLPGHEHKVGLPQTTHHLHGGAIHTHHHHENDRDH